MPSLSRRKGYLTLVNRVRRMADPTGLPVILCGEVIAHHLHLGALLGETMGVQIEIAPDPRLYVTLGAAVIAGKVGSSS